MGQPLVQVVGTHHERLILRWEPPRHLQGPGAFGRKEDGTPRSMGRRRTGVCVGWGREHGVVEVITQDQVWSV